MKHIKLLSMDLQRFADGVDNPDVDEISKDVVVEEVEEKKEKTFTRADLAKIVAAERNKWESEELKPKLEQAKSEGEKYAQMTAEEKVEAESIKKLEQIEKREADITRRELRAESIGRLNEANLPGELVDMLNLSSAEECQKSFELVQNIWEQANGTFDERLEVAVNERLKGSVFTPGGVSGNKGDNKGSIGKRLAEQNKESRSKTNPYFKEN